VLPKEFSRQVSTTEGERFAIRMNSLFIETSAKTGINVKDAFQEVVENILDTPELWEGVKGSVKTSTMVEMVAFQAVCKS